jgi:hypothetical protein
VWTLNDFGADGFCRRRLPVVDGTFEESASQ